jgi:SAM-dependent methyltransferase
MTQTRLEHDLLGEREVPAERYYGIQTLRALENFNMTGIAIAHYPRLVKPLAYIKKATALTNMELGLLAPHLAQAITKAGDLLIGGYYHNEFVVDVIQGGAGSGANFHHYDLGKVTRLYALEPNPGMIRLAEKKRRETRLNIEFLDLPGERIPLGDATIDTVVSTFALCTIPGIIDAIRGFARILKPDGKLIFFELGLSPDASVQRRQRPLEPVYHWLFQGLYLTRDIPALLMQGGFQIEQIEKGYLAQFPKSASYCWWGIAQRCYDESGHDAGTAMRVSVLTTPFTLRRATTVSPSDSRVSVST